MALRHSQSDAGGGPFSGPTRKSGQRVDFGPQSPANGEI
jgi:hypothetical protein